LVVNLTFILSSQTASQYHTLIFAARAASTSPLNICYFCRLAECRQVTNILLIWTDSAKINLMKLKTKNCLSAKTAAILNAIVLIYLLPLVTNAQQEPITRDDKPCKTIVVGFVGGISSPNDPKQGVVQIGERLRKLDRPDLQVKVYSHWHWKRAYRWIYQSIDSSRDNKLSKEEISSAPKVVIYGHSLGGWTLIKLSRSLERQGISVELTVQIDSIGIGDEVIPKMLSLL
jgi:hypothetical protein